MQAQRGKTNHKASMWLHEESLLVFLVNIIQMPASRGAVLWEPETFTAVCGVVGGRGVGWWSHEVAVTSWSPSSPFHPSQAYLQLGVYFRSRADKSHHGEVRYIQFLLTKEKEGKRIASLNGQTAVTLGSPVKRAVINVQIMNHPCIFVKARP